MNNNTSDSEASFAVVIPAYNEGRTIRELVGKVLTYTPHVIVVDDASTDDTVAQLRGLSIELLQNGTNRGKAGSLWRGMQVALLPGDGSNIRHVITMDGDGQHNPADIPGLINMARSHPQCLVIAARLKNREHAPKARLFANNFADFWISWAAAQWVHDSQSGFRLYPVALLRTVKVPHTRERSFVFESEMAIESARHGFPCVAMPIESLYLPDGRPSHLRPAVDITRIVLMVAWKLISRGMYLQGLLKLLLNRKP